MPPSDDDQSGAPTPGERHDVGLVVVSHSRALARAVVVLASEMLHGRKVRIEVAAGLDDTTLGTDAVRIKEAIERADGPDGVVVLMDLGSAVLSAELALDLLADPSARDRIILSPAPIVEGMVVAAVAAAGGAGRAEVAAEARGALLGKSAHLHEPAEGSTGEDADPTADDIVGVFTVTNVHGLHARPLARLVSEVRGLDARVTLRNLTTGAGPVPAGSLSRAATLAALQGHQVEIRASGPQAGDAVEHLLSLARRQFDEPADTGNDHSGALASTEAGAAAGPLPASPGIAIGPVRKLTSATVDSSEEAVLGSPDTEWRRIVEALAAVRREIEHVRLVTTREVGSAEAGIFDAHLALLADAEMLGDIKARINGGSGAMVAWTATLAEVEKQWSALPDPYLRARAADVRAVGQQVLAVLSGASTQRLRDEGILVAGDLTPAQAAGLDAGLVRGVILAYGSASSHAAILARAREIPVIVAAGHHVLAVPAGVTVVFDGTSGDMHIDPPADVIDIFRERADAFTRRRAEHFARAQQPATSRDGTTITVLANLGSISDAKASVAAGTDGAGLVRTEFLFLDRDTAPSLDEQQREYVAIAEAMAGRPVTYRTLDVGGDKPLSYIPVPAEANPYLGQRGIRLSLARPDLLHDQLVALCRAAARFPIRVMFPMISTLGELLEARQILADAAGTSGVPPGMQVGIMVEVPATALKIETFLPHVDFVSIGTNDLTQYTLAAERGNAAVAALSDALDPSVLQLIDQVCRAAHGRAGVSVCGEAASDEASIAILLGLGVRALSVSPLAVPRVKAAVRDLTLDRCVEVAQQALSVASATEVRKLVLASMPT